MGLFNRDWEANTMRWRILRCVGQAVICGLLMICVVAAGGQEKKAKQANDDGEARIFIGQGPATLDGTALRWPWAACPVPAILIVLPWVSSTC